jgi:hypothetical protein
MFSAGMYELGNVQVSVWLTGVPHKVGPPIALSEPPLLLLSKGLSLCYF